MWPSPWAIYQNTGPGNRRLVEGNFKDRWAAARRLRELKIKPIKDPLLRGVEYPAEVGRQLDHW